MLRIMEVMGIVPSNDDIEKSLKKAYEQNIAGKLHPRPESSKSDEVTVLACAVVGIPSKQTLIWSGSSQGMNPTATFHVNGDWATQIARATEEYIAVVASIYENYLLFQELEPK